MPRSLLACLVFLFPSFAMAAQVTYTCEISPRKNEDLVPRQAVFRIDPGKKTATVFDPIIKYAYKTPVVAAIATKADGSYELNWSVSGLPAVKTRTAPYHSELNTSTDFKFSVRYTALLDPRSGDVKLRGFSRTFGSVRGEGTCKR